jgi:hypothetical protein
MNHYSIYSFLISKEEYSMTSHEQKTFLNALNYLTTQELEELCNTLTLPASGTRDQVIARIYRRVTTPPSTHTALLPQVSLAKPGSTYPLRKETLILKGSFKTNAATKHFLQKLAGPEFSFTPFGQDWISQQWQKGTPPTYEAFARYWKQEYAKRKELKEAPREEWAYETFKQQFSLKYPDASKQELAHAWDILREKQLTLAKKYVADA